MQGVSKPDSRILRWSVRVRARQNRTFHNAISRQIARRCGVIAQLLARDSLAWQLHKMFENELHISTVQIY